MSKEEQVNKALIKVLEKISGVEKSVLKEVERIKLRLDIIERELKL